MYFYVPTTLICEYNIWFLTRWLVSTIYQMVIQFLSSSRYLYMRAAASNILQVYCIDSFPLQPCLVHLAVIQLKRYQASTKKETVEKQFVWKIRR